VTAYWFFLIAGLTFLLGAWLANLEYALGRWLMGAVVVLAVVLALTSLVLRVTGIDGFACVIPLIELTADSARVRGTVIERQFGCTLYYYETPGAGD
jgi:hypothetical protein